MNQLPQAISAEHRREIFFGELQDLEIHRDQTLMADEMLRILDLKLVIFSTKKMCLMQTRLDSITEKFLIQTRVTVSEETFRTNYLNSAI